MRELITEYMELGLPFEVAQACAAICVRVLADETGKYREYLAILKDIQTCTEDQLPETFEK